MDDKLQATEILSKGYGIIPKTVMVDRDLSSTSKAIYSYFCSFAGAGKLTCFPARAKICYDLKLSQDTLGKHLKVLSEKGYIKIEQVKENGKFSHNIYTLNMSSLSLPKNTDTEIFGNGKVVTNNNNPNNNSILNNNSINTSGKSEEKGNIPYEKIRSYWNEKNSDLGKVTKITENRKKAIRARIKDSSIEQIFEAIDIVAATPFFHGKNDRKWRASFDWILNQNKFFRILEHFYDNCGNVQREEAPKVDEHGRPYFKPSRQNLGNEPVPDFKPSRRR